MLNLSSSADILIIQKDRNEDSQNWINEIKKPYELATDWHHCNYSAISECLNMYPDTLIVLDLSDDFEIQMSLSQICEENKKIHLVSQKKYESYYYDEWTYSIFPSHSAEMKTYFTILDYFNWTQGLVITDEDNISSKQHFLDYSAKFNYLTIESSGNIENLVNQIIKPLGTTLYYIFANSVLSSKIQDTLKSKKLLLKGDGIILNQNSGYGCKTDGAIIITIKGQEYVSSEDESLFNSAVSILQYLLNSTVESVEELKYLLKKYNEKSLFSIVNVQKSKREIVGLVSDKTITILGNLTFPGNVQNIPKSDKKILHVSVSGGATNPGTPPMTSIPPLYYGAYTAWKLINDGTLGILKNFQIEYFIFDCGVINFDENFATACFAKDIEKIGLAFISAPSSSVTAAQMKLFERLNLTFPIVGGVNGDISLNSTATYPMFTRIAISFNYMMTLASLLLKGLDWHKICVLYDFMYTYKIKEVGVPMITISGQNWVGKVGQLAYSKIASLYNTVPSSYACYFYDAAYYIASALDSIIHHGLDYYDPYQLNLTLREQKFAGCTGKVSIDKNSNDRIMEIFDIMVNKIDPISGNITAYKMGVFQPYSSTMLIIDTPIVYGDGSTIKPDDLRNQDSKCPFSDKLVKTFTKGRMLTFGICIAFALISFASTAYIWKKWWNINIEELKERKEISLQDFIVQLTIGIEFLQYQEMGPDITPINSFLAKVSNYFSLNLENILNLKNGVFWIVIDGVYGSIIVWLILCATILLRLDEKFPRVSLFRFLAWIADYLMPILGNLCFIPFISMCLNVFVCDQSIGENFTDSFLAQDCYYFCWKGDHLLYAIFSFIALLCYEPLAVYCRPLWQELQNNLHINTSPLFLMVKTIVQVIFIVMNKTVKRADSTVHGALFAILMAAYIGFIFRWKPYNYPRLCWWQTLSLIGVLWLSVLSTISSNIKGNHLIYLLLIIIGWIVIIIVGIHVQRKKYPSLLYRRKGLDTNHLYRFAFTFGKHSRNALSKIAPRRSSKTSVSKDFQIIKEVS